LLDAGDRSLLSLLLSALSPWTSGESITFGALLLAFAMAQVVGGEVSNSILALVCAVRKGATSAL